SLHGIGTLSPNFAENIGPDAVVVRSGPLTIPANFFPGGSSPNPFALIPFSTPYVYRGGDLLLTIRHSGRSGTMTVRTDGNTVDSFGRAIFGEGPDATTALSLNANYPITELVFQAVPEPSTLMPAAFAALAGLGAFWRRRQSRRA